MKKEQTKKSIKEIGIGTVLGWILGALAVSMGIFSAIVTIKAGQILVGFLFIIPSAFVLIPRKYFRITKPLKVVIFILSYLIILYWSGVNNPVPAQQFEYYNLGQPFNLIFGSNNFSMVILNVSNSSQVNINGEIRSSTGIYISVNGKVKNLQKEPVNFNTSPELKDSLENTYTLIGISMIKGALQPSIERDVSYIFEIPKEATGLKLFIKDKNSAIKVIDLER